MGQRGREAQLGDRDRTLSLYNRKSLTRTLSVGSPGITLRNAAALRLLKTTFETALTC